MSFTIELVVDNRERDLIIELQQQCDAYNLAQASKPGFQELKFGVRNLPIGDAVLERVTTATADQVSSGSGGDGSVTPIPTYAYVFERKTLADLASSIVDKRHRSQALRLIACMQTDQAKVEMLCEIPQNKRGFLDVNCNANPFPGTRINAGALRSAILNGEMRDGISAKILASTKETAQHLISRLVYGRKHIDNLRVHTVITQPQDNAPVVEGGQCPPVNEDRIVTGAPLVEALEIVAHKKKKNANATQQTCFADMLSSINGVGLKRAIAIATKFGSMKALLAELTQVDAFMTQGDHKNAKKTCKALFEDVDGVGADTAFSIYKSLGV
jgi:ERCC4-type nuclease